VGREGGVSEAATRPVTGFLQPAGTTYQIVNLLRLGREEGGEGVRNWPGSGRALPAGPPLILEEKRKGKCWGSLATVFYSNFNLTIQGGGRKRKKGVPNPPRSLPLLSFFTFSSFREERGEGREGKERLQRCNEFVTFICLRGGKREHCTTALLVDRLLMKGRKGKGKEGGEGGGEKGGEGRGVLLA